MSLRMTFLIIVLLAWPWSHLPPAPIQDAVSLTRTGLKAKAEVGSLPDILYIRGDDALPAIGESVSSPRGASGDTLSVGTRGGSPIAVQSSETATNMQPRWSLETDRSISGVQVVRQTVLAISGTTVFGVDLETGAAWELNTPVPGGSEARLLTSSSGGVFVAADGFVAALELASGKILWERTLGESGWFTLGDSGDTGIILTATDLMAIDLRTGNTQWEHPADNAATAWATINHGRIFTWMMGPDVQIQAFDVSTGAELWTHQLNSIGLFGLEFSEDGNQLVTVSAAESVQPGRSTDTEVVALDPVSGSQIWRVPLGNAQHLTSFTVVGNRLLVGSPEALLFVEMANGLDIWAIVVPASASWFFAANADAAYGLTDDGSVIRLDTETGDVEWSYSIGDPTLMGPQVTMMDDSVYLATSARSDEKQSGFFAAELSANTGVDLWRVPLIEPAVAAPFITDHGILLWTRNISTDGDSLALYVPPTGR